MRTFFIGMLLAYILMDIAHDGSVLRVIREERARLRESVEASQRR